MWHDIAPEGESDYHHWHTKQHMVERLAHPGFIRSRRGVSPSADRQRFLTVYEGTALETFISAEYLASLNDPTRWTAEVAPHFRNFLRCVCELAFSSGKGVGGALATFRANLPDGVGADELVDIARDRFDALLAQATIGGVHVGIPRKGFGDVPTRETEIRPAMSEDGFDFVVMVESYGLQEIEALVPIVLSNLEAIGAVDVLAQKYETAFTLENSEISANDSPRALYRGHVLQQEVDTL